MNDNFTIGSFKIHFQKLKCIMNKILCNEYWYFLSWTAWRSCTITTHAETKSWRLGSCISPSWYTISLFNWTIVIFIKVSILIRLFINLSISVMFYLRWVKMGKLTELSKKNRPKVSQTVKSLNRLLLF